MAGIYNCKSDIVKVNVSNSKNDSVAFEIKFAKDLTIDQLKNKLEILTGGCAQTMKLELYKGDRLISQIANNGEPLGSYPIDDGMRIHVIDNFTSFGDDNIEKFELTEEQYAQKSETLRTFLKSNRLGKYNEAELREAQQKAEEEAVLIQKKIDLCKIGARCQVTVANNPKRRGAIRYIGPLDGKKGVFIGVQYDEPLGKNNGSIAGKVYFVCDSNYGGFVSPLSVEVGDFPPEDCGLDDEL